MNKIGRILAYASRKCQLGKRSFLSDAYKCQEVWNGRLNSSVMKKINLDNMYQELDQAFQNNGKASVVDIDLFSNSIQDESFADELEDIIHKLRLSQYTSSMLPSTHHAVIRAYLAMGKYDALMRILNDRLNYGIFPDCYSSNLMMDTFLKAKKYREAAKVATFQMLQEDWGHPITSFLGLLSCHMYLKSEDSEPWEVEIHENDEPEEEIKVRVNFIQNKYFDDHFDLREPNHLIGKTFVTLSKALPENDPVRTTYELMGWALYEKWEKAKSLLHKISSEEKDFLIPEGVQLMEKVLNGSNNEQTKDEAKDLLNLVSTLPSSKLQGQSSLLDLIKARVQEAVSEQEKIDIENQIIKLKSWDDLREKEVQIQAETRQKESIMKLVREKKKELSEKEEELFFFENKDKLDLMAENNDLLRSKLISDTKNAKKADDDYIPPDVK